MSDWNPQANEIFLAAVELPSPEERRALLNERCGADSGLRAQVESLLAASESAGSFLEHPAVEGPETARLDRDSRSDSPPQCTERTQLDFRDDQLDFLLPAESPDALGRIGPYEVAELIGRGGMGIVLKARDEKLNRVVAIKVLAAELSGNATARRRFLREAQAAAAVTHQHVVTIHAVEKDRLPYLVMEFVDGQSLQEKIDREGPLGLKEILRVGAQVASGLAAAHAQGLIHRDIKPANILLENGVERVRITDFGLARAVDDVSVTKTGEVHGTPQYMSPEQAEGKSVDARTDLFNLGCVLYAMCTGRSPFRAETTVAAIRRVCDDTPRPIREVNPETPQWLADIVDRLLEKNPDDRIQTATETADLLGRHLAHVQDPDSTSHPEPLQPRGSRAKPRRGWIVAASLLVVVGFGLLETAGVIDLIDTSEPINSDGETTDGPAPAVITEVRRFEGHIGSVKQIAVSPDGTLALSGSGYPAGDRSVRLWEVATGQEIRALDTSGTQILTVCFSHDGQRAAAGGFGGVIYIWDVETGRQITSISTDTEVVDDLEFAPEDRHLLCATHKRAFVRDESISGWGKAQLWDADTEELVWEYKSTGWLTTAAFLHDGERVIVAGKHTGRQIQVLDRNTGDELEQLQLGDVTDHQIEELAVSHDGQFIAAASELGYLCLWGVNESEEPLKHRTNLGNLRSVAFSPDGSRLLCGGGEGEYGNLQLLEVPSLKRIASLEHPSGLVWHVAYLPDGQRALSAGGFAEQGAEGDYALRLWRLPKSAEATSGATATRITEILRFDGHTGPVNRVVFSRDGTLALSGSGREGGDLTARLWDVATGRELHLLNADGRQILAVCFSPDGRRSAGGGIGGVVYVWDLTSGDEIGSFPTGAAVVEDVEFAPEGRHLLCVAHKSTPEHGTPDLGTAQLWDTQTEKMVWQIDSGWLTTGAFLSEERILIGGWGTGGAVHVLDAETGDEQQRWQNGYGEPYRVQELAVSYDGKFVATASELGYVCLWDVESGGTPVEIKHDTGYLKSVSFSPDGSRLLIGGQDGRIQLLDVPTLRTVASAQHPSGRVWSVAYAPDGNHALSGGGLAEEELSAYSLLLWQLPESAPSVDEESQSLHDQIAELTEQIAESPGDGSVRIARAHLYVRESRWQDVADDLQAAGDTVYEEPGNAFLYAILLVFLEEDDLYQQHCAKMLEHFADTDDVWTANCLAKSCLLRPGVLDLDSLPTHLLSDDYGFASGEPGWVVSEARALLAYRSGEYEEARELIREAMDEPSYRDDPLYASRALCILAMAAQKSGDAPLAQGLFDQAVEQFERIRPGPDDVRASGWLYAELLRREAVEVLDGAPLTGARSGSFVIPGDVERRFETLADAVASSAPGDVIEIREDGPFPTPPIRITHPLRIRAGRGCRPVITAATSSNDVYDPVIDCAADVVLGGITVERPAGDFSPSNPPAWRGLICSSVDTLLCLVNCRLLNVRGSCLQVAGALDARNCDFEISGEGPVTADGAAILWESPASGGSLIRNCILKGTLNFDPRSDATSRLEIELCGNSFLQNALSFDVAEIPEGSRSPAVLIDAQRNAFAPNSVVISVSQTAETKEVSAETSPAQALRLILDWRDQRNVYPSGENVVGWYAGTVNDDVWERRSVPPGQGLAAWLRFWELNNTHSIAGSVKYQGGDLLARHQAGSKPLINEDFRLRSDSAGFQGGANGEDLGADIPRVGPGAAYERWRQTPEYGEWLKTTAQLMDGATE